MTTNKPPIKQKTRPVVITLRLTESEGIDLAESVAKTGIKQAELVRAALRNMGLIRAKPPKKCSEKA